MSKKIPLELNKRVRLFRNCSVCGSKDGLSLGTLDYALFDGATIIPKFEVVCCAECGFVTANTPSTQGDYDAFYTDSFYSPEYLALALSDAEKKYFNETVDILTEIADRKDIAVFDIGCGVGWQLETLRQHEFTNLRGVDPSAACVKLLTEQKNISCESGTISSIPFPGVAPELLILSHVIEHIIDIKSSLGSMASRLSANGKVYIEVPDAERYEEYCPNKPLAYFFFQHVIHFDYRHLRNLFIANGFKEINSGHRLREEKGFNMPCIWAVFQKDELQKGNCLPDFTLAMQIKNWFDNTSLDPKGQFAELVVSQAPVYIWGIGYHAHMTLAMSPLSNCNIKALVDKSEQIQKKTINGRKIESLDVLKKATRDEVVVISTVAHKDRMYQYLIEDLNFKGQVIHLW